MTLSRRQQRVMMTLLIVLGLNVATLFFPEIDRWLAEQKTPNEKPASSSLTVARVLDGDTFELESGEKVRLIGIDAPESVKPGTSVECYGREASDHLKALIEGKTLELEADKRDRDRYDRLLRYAYLEGVFINEVLVGEGHARAVSYPPDTSRQETLRAAEQKARAEQRGLWGRCTSEAVRN